MSLLKRKKSLFLLLMNQIGSIIVVIFCFLSLYRLSMSFSEIAILLIFSKVNNELIRFGKIFFLAKITNTHIEYKGRRDYYSNRHDIIRNGDNDNPNIINMYMNTNENRMKKRRMREIIGI